MDILWKGIIGGIITAVIALLSKRGNILPGILPLFPTFGLIALYLIGMKGEPNGFLETSIAGMKTIPAYLAFLIVCYISIQKWEFRIALLYGLAAWFVVALVMFLLPKLF